MALLEAADPAMIVGKVVGHIQLWKVAIELASLLDEEFVCDVSILRFLVAKPER